MTTDTRPKVHGHTPGYFLPYVLRHGWSVTKEDTEFTDIARRTQYRFSHPTADDVVMFYFTDEGLAELRQRCESLPTAELTDELILDMVGTMLGSDVQRHGAPTYEVGAVTAGQVADMVGHDRAKVKRRLDRLVSQGKLLAGQRGDEWSVLGYRFGYVRYRGRSTRERTEYWTHELQQAFIDWEQVPTEQLASQCLTAVGEAFAVSRTKYSDRPEFWPVSVNHTGYVRREIDAAVGLGLLIEVSNGDGYRTVVPAALHDAWTEAVEISERAEAKRQAIHEAAKTALNEWVDSEDIPRRGESINVPLSVVQEILARLDVTIPEPTEPTPESESQ